MSEVAWPEDENTITVFIDELDAMVTIISMLTAVAQPIVGNDEGNHWCPLCEASTYTFDLHAEPPVHEPTCPWRMAREMQGLPWKGWNPDDKGGD